MSSHNEDTETDPVRQDNFVTNSQFRADQARYYRVYADIGEVIFGVISGELFCLLCKRLALLIQGVWLPSSGCGDTNAVAALMNRAESTIQQQLDSNRVPRAHPGTSNLFEFASVPGAFNAPVFQEAPKQPKKRVRRRS